MSKSTSLSFSQPHDSGSGEHVDTYRNQSDSPNTEKIEHSPSTPGTVGSSQSADIPINHK
jgi:hypothetical protein